MINKFVSLSLMTSNKDFHNLTESQLDYLTYERESISRAIISMSDYVVSGEVIIIVNSEDEKSYYLNEDLPEKENIDVKIVSTTKRSKKYVMQNLGWKTAIGDIVIHVDISENPTALSFDYTLFDYIANRMNTHLTFIELTENNFAQKLYKKINLAYNEQVLPEKSIGFIVTRQAINLAFSSQSEIDDPFLLLGLSGLTYDIYQFATVNEYSHTKSSRYSNSEIDELMLIYTNLNSNLLKSALMSFVISILLTLCITTIFTNLSIFQTLSILSTSSIVFLPIFEILSKLKNTYILQRHTLAAARDKNLVGQISITNRQSKSFE